MAPQHVTPTLGLGAGPDLRATRCKFSCHDTATAPISDPAHDRFAEHRGSDTLTSTIGGWV